MKQTDNLKLRLYDSDDLVNITGPTNSLNHNMELIDETINNTQKELTTQSDRIDNLILNSGDSSTEVIDARVGVGGKTYSTLKERLDTENSEIKSEYSTYSTKTEVSVVEGKADDALAAANANSENLTNFINTTTNNLEDLQGQLDGSIMTHFYEYEPTNTNIPASEWTTTELKNNHLGDLFYDTITGYCYRWQVSNNTYSWNRITDVDVTKALADAAKAQDTADNKRRVFVSTPTPPYDVGDLWTQGSDGDLMRCKIAKTSSQSYAAADWEKASKYTDDTKADAVADNLANTNANLSNVTTNLSKAQQDILTNAGLIDSQGDLIAGNTAEIQSQAETISNHESRISRTETDISLKVSSSDFESYKTTVTGTIDTAKSEAISAAEADATSKADQALANAKNYTSAEIETVNESISKANTEITAMKGQIALKVEQSDIDNVETTVKTYVDNEVADTLTEANTYTDEREAAINVTLNGISSKVSSVESSQTTINGNVSDLQTRMSSAEEKITPTAIINTVSSTYATKTENQAALDAAKAAQEDIDNLEIGGRNLVTNSINLSDFEIESSGYVTRTIADDYCTINRLPSEATAMYGIYKDIPVTADEQYTVSFIVKEVTGTMNFSFGYDALSWAGLGSKNLSVGRFIWTVTAPSNATFLRLYINGKDEINGGSVTVSNIKFEKGNQATDWTPAPEDMATQKALTAAETRITQTENSINSQVSETNDLKERMSTVEQTASGLEVRLTTAESDISEAAKTATNFLSYDDTNGLLIGNKTSGEWSGYRSQMLPTAFNILDASGDAMSSYGTTTTIGKKSGQHVYIVPDSLNIKNGDTVLATFSGNMLSCGSNFSVDSSGKINSTSGTIGGFTIGNTYIANNSSGIDAIPTDYDGGIKSTADSVYLGTDGFSNWGIIGQSSASFVKIADGEILTESKHATVGTIYARSVLKDGILTLDDGSGKTLEISSGTCTLTSDKESGTAGYNESITYYLDIPYLNLTGNLSVNYLDVNGTEVSLDGHKHGSLYHTSSGNTCLTCVLDSDIYYVRKGSSMAGINVCSGSATYPWYNVYTENLRVSGGKPIFSYIGSDGSGSTVSYATNMYVASGGTVSRTTNTSSRTIKHDITELKDNSIKAENLYDVNVYQAKYNEDILSDDDPRYLKDLPMFIIEDLDEKYPIVIDKPSENVKEWSWNAQYIIPPMLKLIQNQHQTDINLENKIKDLESKLDKALEIINNLTNN